jgi:hypothetical protein
MTATGCSSGKMMDSHQLHRFAAPDKPLKWKMHSMSHDPATRFAMRLGLRSSFAASARYNLTKNPTMDIVSRCRIHPENSDSSSSN